MALLTAEDILNKKFAATKFREGYDVEEVDDFLDEVVRTLNSVQEENEDLKAKLAAAERRVAELSRADASSAVAAPPVVEAPKPAPEPEAAPVSPISQAVVAKNAAEPESATGMLQLAQKLHDDYVRSGQEEGDRLIAEAKEEGSRIVREAEETWTTGAARSRRAATSAGPVARATSPPASSLSVDRPAAAGTRTHRSSSLLGTAWCVVRTGRCVYSRVTRSGGAS